jgi:hypothetical protein
MSDLQARDHVAAYLHSAGLHRALLTESERWELYCLADGFPGRSEAELKTLNGGWDWSHIRDASPGAVRAISERLTDFGYPPEAKASYTDALDNLLAASPEAVLNAPGLPRDLEAAQALVLRRLGSFWITTTVQGECASATLGPDYNGPHGESLEASWPVAIGDAGFTAEIIALSGRATDADLARAVVLAVVKAERARIDHAPATARSIKDLHQALMQPDQNTFALSHEIRLALGQPQDGRDLTLDLGAVRDLVRAVVPDHGMTTGLCYLTGHATLFVPNGGPRWDEDIEPSEGNADLNCECVALLSCLLKCVGGDTIDALD